MKRRALAIVSIVAVAFLVGSVLNITQLVALGVPETSEETQGVYDAIEALPAGSVAVLSFDFGPSTRTENEPQAKALLFHCEQRGLRMVALAFWASGGPLAHDIISEVYGEGYETGAEYGTEIVYLGYVPGNEVGMQTFGDSTWDAKGTDHFGTAISDIPLMQEVRSAADFDLWIELTSGTPGEQQVIQFIQGRHPGENLGWPAGILPIVVGATAVSVPGMMPFYYAGQIIGILNGLVGAAEYEWLLMVNYGYEPSLIPITVLSPQNVTYVEQPIPLNFTVLTSMPLSWIGYSLDGQANVTISGNTTLPDLPNGKHNIVVYANNSLGITGASEKIHFTVEELFPVACFAYNPAAPYVGDSVEFNASESYDLDGTIISYSWDFGDGKYGAGVTTTHIYTEADTYTIALTVIDDDDHPNTTMADVTVNHRILSIKLSGEHDYAFMEDVRIGLAAHVKDAYSTQPISYANVSIEIYDADGELWVSDSMVEAPLGTAIYQWESENTIRRLRLEKGIYLVHVQASYRGGPTASDMLQFHIDPPAENSSGFPIHYYTLAISVILACALGFIVYRRFTDRSYQQQNQ